MTVSRCSVDADGEMAEYDASIIIRGLVGAVLVLLVRALLLLLIVLLIVLPLSSSSFALLVALADTSRILPRPNSNKRGA